MEQEGFCIKGCPDKYEVSNSGKCKYKEYVQNINAKYIIMLFIVLAVLLLLAILYCIYKKYVVKPRYIEV